MQRKSIIDKTPTLCAHPEEFKAGDILIFNASPHGGSSSNFTAFQQGLLNEPGGHREAGHAGFVVDIDGELKVAHLMGAGFFLEDITKAELFKKAYSKLKSDFRAAKMAAFNNKEDLNDIAKQFKIDSEELKADNSDLPYLATYLNQTTNVYRPREKYRAELNAHLTDLVNERVQGEKDSAKKHVKALGKGEPTENSLLLELDEVGLFGDADYRMEEAHAEQRSMREKARDRINAFKAKFKLKWSVLTAMRSMFGRLFGSLKIRSRDINTKTVEHPENLADTVIAKDSICSKYVADTYISACNRLTKDSDSIKNRNVDGNNNNNEQEYYNYRRKFMNASSYTVPKTLEAYLYRNPYYDYLVMPHDRENIFEKIKAKILVEINRLQDPRNSQAAQDKADALERRLNGQKDLVYDDAIKASIVLLKACEDVLLFNTGRGVRTPDSYKRVMLYARQQGIYPEYVKNDLHYPGDIRPKQIKGLSTLHYKYDSTQAGLYKSFRSLGYTNQQARFEADAKPTFDDWFQLSPARNIALSCTVVGFFAWVLPRGLSRLKQVNEQRAAAEEHNNADRLRVS